MIQILICNVGYRPIILTRFRALGNSSAFGMGIYDEPSAAYGVREQRFPFIINPGDTHTIHPMAVAALERNQTDPDDAKVHFSPFRYFVLEDSFGRFHSMDIEDVLRELRIGSKWKRPRGIRRLQKVAQRWMFLRKARKRFRS